jgi:hypothetical protein
MLSISTPFLPASNDFVALPSKSAKPASSIVKHSLTEPAPASAAAMCAHYNGRCGGSSSGIKQNNRLKKHECCGQHGCSTPASNQKSVFNLSKNI